MKQPFASASIVKNHHIGTREWLSQYKQFFKADLTKNKMAIHFFDHEEERNKMAQRILPLIAANKSTIPWLTSAGRSQEILLWLCAYDTHYSSFDMTSAAFLALFLNSPSSQSSLLNSTSLPCQSCHRSSQKPCFPFHKGPPDPGAPPESPGSAQSQCAISRPATSTSAIAAGMLHTDR